MTLRRQRPEGGSATESHAERRTTLYPSLRKTDNNPTCAAKLGIRVYTGRLMSEKPETHAASSDRAEERARMGRDIVALLPRLRRFAAGLTGSVHDGDDVVQAACLRALERYHQWEPGTRLDSWMFRIIRNLWLDRGKSAWNRLVRSDPDALVEIPDHSLGREIEVRDELASARTAIAALPEAQREVLLLVTVEGLTYEAAADVLGVPLGTVMSRLARARVAVARQVRGETHAAPGPQAGASVTRRS
jgi:RNA polymerase sigma-70 factor (ECF subfamily)